MTCPFSRPSALRGKSAVPCGSGSLKEEFMDTGFDRREVLLYRDSCDFKVSSASISQDLQEVEARRGGQGQTSDWAMLRICLKVSTGCWSDPSDLRADILSLTHVWTHSGVVFWLCCFHNSVYRKIFSLLQFRQKSGWVVKASREMVTNVLERSETA